MATLPTHVLTERGVPGDPAPDRLLVLLHGFDADERGLTAVGPLLDPVGRHLIAGVRGPVATGSGWAWFASGPLGPDPATFDASLAALDETLDALCAEHLMGRDHVVIGGFSQGAAMAVAVALAPGRAPRPAGAMCLSGFFADVAGFDPDWAAAAGLPVLVQHGSLDDVVPVELGRDTAALLEHHGLSVELREYEMGHQTTLESLTDARTWLAGLGD